MRRAIWWGVAALAILVAAFFVLAPGIVERSMNKVEPTEAIARHQSTDIDVARPMPDVSDTIVTGPIVDLHADTLLWSRSLLTRSGRGQVDLPRLQQGNVALQVFSSVTKTPRGQNYDSNGDDSDNITPLVIAQLQPVRTWGSLLNRSLWHATKLRREARASNGELRLITTPRELDALLAARANTPRCRIDGPQPHDCIAPTGALLSIEGLNGLEGSLNNLDRLYRSGFRMAGLTHFYDNEVAGSMHGRAKGGLTPFGRRVVARMEDKGMIVDVAHLSHAGIADVLKLARRPVVSSHGGVQATCKVNRNLTDDEVRGIARTGGVVGIGYWAGAVCSTDPKAIAKAIVHVRDVAGIDHVALGSDFDGAVTTAFDAGWLWVVTEALHDAGLTQDELDKVMGGNAIRVLRGGMQPLSPPAPAR
ncbi:MULTISPECIES: dipeptidase [unclassified Sphingomonas]|uniref:dipeptidase n=1 Tax=unclassified Sphingomonas TaxID=196159 RepID=UPI0007022699|nr:MULTISPECIES: dipeptidase [unclassified Sphingomonas]KQM62132.1 peptidase M19 [Sphingomonas sp. Leaf16]KQN13535.1 peptidase M19 [Sphingomonas sp. Leaf29]KQN23231.1 peptidase M19 [Sphingomonas sp. Leaf32]